MKKTELKVVQKENDELVTAEVLAQSIKQIEDSLKPEKALEEKIKSQSESIQKLELEQIRHIELLKEEFIKEIQSLKDDLEWCMGYMSGGFARSGTSFEDEKITEIKTRHRLK